MAQSLSGVVPQRNERPTTPIVPRDRVFPEVKLAREREALDAAHRIQEEAGRREAKRRGLLDGSVRNTQIGRAAAALHPQWESARLSHRLHARASEVLADVMMRTSVSVEMILGDRRTKEVTEARQQAYVAIRDAFPEWTVSRIGKLFRKDHTTVLHSLRKLRQVV